METNDRVCSRTRPTRASRAATKHSTQAKSTRTASSDLDLTDALGSPIGPTPQLSSSTPKSGSRAPGGEECCSAPVGSREAGSGHSTTKPSGKNQNNITPTRSGRRRTLSLGKSGKPGRPQLKSGGSHCKRKRSPSITVRVKLSRSMSSRGSTRLPTPGIPNQVPSTSRAPAPPSLSAEPEWFTKFTQHLDSRLNSTNANITALDGNVVAVSNSLVSRVDGNSSEIAVLKETVKALSNRPMVEIETKVSEAVGKEIEKRCRSLAPPVAQLGPIRPNERGREREDDYWRARRSVRIWPVAGATSVEIWRASGVFFNDVLEIPVSDLPENTVEEVRRIVNKRRARPGGLENTQRVADEVLVVFKDVAIRDMVMSYAPNLAKTNGLPQSSGIRMEIPPHLLGVFRTLDDHGHMLRGRHGQGVKRNIKFDDGEMSLYMDLRLPGDNSWMRVDYEMAREELRFVKKQESQNTRNRIASVGSAPRDGDSTPTPAQRLSTSSLPESATLASYAKPWGLRK